MEEKKLLFTTFVEASDSVAALPWRIYDVGQHNKLLYTDYSHAYACENPESDNIVPNEVDDYIVRSMHIKKNCVCVYVSTT